MNPISKFHINNTAKLILGISYNEYLLCETVNILQKKTGSCYASKEYLATCLGISRRAVTKLINNMETQGFITNNKRDISVSEKWSKCVYDNDFSLVQNEKKVPKSEKKVLNEKEQPKSTKWEESSHKVRRKFPQSEKKVLTI